MCVLLCRKAIDFFIFLLWSTTLLLNVIVSNHLVKSLGFSMCKKKGEHKFLSSCLFTFNFLFCLTVLAKISSIILSEGGGLCLVLWLRRSAFNFFYAIWCCLWFFNIELWKFTVVEFFLCIKWFFFYWWNLLYASISWMHTITTLILMNDPFADLLNWFGHIMFTVFIISGHQGYCFIAFFILIWILLTGYYCQHLEEFLPFQSFGTVQSRLVSIDFFKGLVDAHAWQLKHQQQ